MGPKQQAFADWADAKKKAQDYLADAIANVNAAFVSLPTEENMRTDDLILLGGEKFRQAKYKLQAAQRLILDARCPRPIMEEAEQERQEEERDRLRRNREQWAERAAESGNSSGFGFPYQDIEQHVKLSASTPSPIDLGEIGYEAAHSVDELSGKQQVHSASGTNAFSVPCSNCNEQCDNFFTRVCNGCLDKLR
ncbi:hypothetical protein Tiera_042 [Polaromonas phage Tiera]|nr:hypothetical protein Tiera_042 [Polaromonas phage Tiera]